MIDKLKKYAYLEKSYSQLVSEEIVNGICLKLWNESGYATAHYLGAINQLKAIASALKESDYLTKNDIVRLIATYKDDKNAPDEIKNLIKTILEEFDYKED